VSGPGGLHGVRRGARYIRGRVLMRRPWVLTSTGTSMAPGGRVTGHSRDNVTPGGRATRHIGSVTGLCSSVVLQRGSVVLQSGREAVVLPATAGVECHPQAVEFTATPVPGSVGLRSDSVVLQGGREAVSVPAAAGVVLRQAVVLPATPVVLPDSVVLQSDSVVLQGGREAVVLPATAGVVLRQAVVSPATSVVLPDSVGLRSDSVVLQSGRAAVGLPAPAGGSITPGGRVTSHIGRVTGLRNITERPSGGRVPATAG